MLTFPLLVTTWRAPLPHYLKGGLGWKPRVVAGTAVRQADRRGNERADVLGNADLDGSV